MRQGLVLPKKIKVSREYNLLLLTFLFGVIFFPFSSYHGSNFPAAFADTTTWARSYGGAELDREPDVWQTSDGGYIVAGFTDSFGSSGSAWILKLDSNGLVEWQNTYEGRANQPATSVQETADGGYVVTGTVFVIGADRDYDVRVLKLDSDGAVEWDKAYGGEERDFSPFIEQTLDNGFIVVATTESFVPGSGNHDFWVIKLDATGEVDWEKTYGEDDRTEFAASIHQTTDGGYIVQGSIFGPGAAMLIKLDSDGSVEWEKAYGFSEHAYAAFSSEQTSDGGYIVGGQAFDDAWLMKVDSDGALEWEERYGGDDFGFAIDARQTTDGGYIVAGGADDDALLLKVDPEGNIEWQKSYGGNQPDSANSVQQTSDGGYVFAGFTESFGAGGGDLWVLKVDSEGNIANCDATDLINDTDVGVNDPASSIEDTDSSVRNSTASIDDLEFPVQNTSASVADSCDPSSKIFDYGLQPFESSGDPSDGVINLGEEVLVLAETDDINVFEVEFRWIDPSGDVARAFVVGSVNEPLTSAQDTFTPDEKGTWTVEADFGNGQIIRKTLDVSFFVLPESPIGSLAMVGASMAALGGYLYVAIKKRGNSS